MIDTGVYTEHEYLRKRIKNSSEKLEAIYKCAFGRIIVYYNGWWRGYTAYLNWNTGTRRLTVLKGKGRTKRLALKNLLKNVLFEHAEEKDEKKL